MYITTGATLLMNVFSLGLNLKNDIVTIQRDLRLPDNTLLSAEIRIRYYYNAVDAPLERVLTKGNMQVQAFAQNMTTRGVCGADRRGEAMWRLWVWQQDLCPDTTGDTGQALL